MAFLIINGLFVVDQVIPILLNPLNGATNVPNQDIVLTFNRNVSYFGGEVVNVNGSPWEIDASVSGAQVTLSPMSPITAGASVEVIIPSGAVRNADLFGMAWNGFSAGQYTFTMAA